jgi:hypothetical protein
MNTELLTLEQFAERLLISRSTAYSWLAEGRLVAGTHYIRLNRVIRVLWCDALVSHLLALSVQEPEVPLIRLKRKGKGGRNQCALDFNYLDVN